MNQLHKILLREPPETIVDDIVAQPTQLGWVLGGQAAARLPRVDGAITAAHIVCCSAALSAASSGLTAPAKDLERLWNLETGGIRKKPANSPLSAAEKTAVRQFEDGISYGENCYTAP